MWGCVREGHHTALEARGGRHMPRQEDLLILEELWIELSTNPSPKQR